MSTTTLWILLLVSPAGINGPYGEGFATQESCVLAASRENRLFLDVPVMRTFHVICHYNGGKS